MNTSSRPIPPGVSVTHNPNFLHLEAQRFVGTNFLFSDRASQAYELTTQNLTHWCEQAREEQVDAIFPPSNNFTVVLSFFDETRCFNSLKAWIDFYNGMCKIRGVKPQRMIAIVSDLCYAWDEHGWDTNVSEYNGCELLYVNYSDKVYLFNKYNKMNIRSQAWQPDAEKILFLPGHMLQLSARMPMLEKLQAIYGVDKIKYTLNIPHEDDDRSWENYSFRMLPGMDMAEWKKYLKKFATNIGSDKGVHYVDFKQNMSGIDMPGEIYNDCLIHLIGRYSHRTLTEKVPRAILNDMPVFMQNPSHVDSQGYLYNSCAMDLRNLKEDIEEMKSNPTQVRQMLDYNKNLLNTRGEQFYKYLDDHLMGNLETLFLEGGLFSHAM
jgi:hypothetical protein